MTHDGVVLTSVKSFVELEISGMIRQFYSTSTVRDGHVSFDFNFGDTLVMAGEDVRVTWHIFHGFMFKVEHIRAKAPCGELGVANRETLDCRESVYDIEDLKGNALHIDCDVEANDFLSVLDGYQNEYTNKLAHINQLMDSERRLTEELEENEAAYSKRIAEDDRQLAEKEKAIEEYNERYTNYIKGELERLSKTWRYGYALTNGAKQVAHALSPQSIATLASHVNPQTINKMKRYVGAEGLPQGMKHLFSDYKAGQELREARESYEVSPLIKEYESHTTIGEFEPIDFPEVENPTVSIVIPVYNQFAYTYNCLRAIKECTGGVTYEIIIGDDCSTDLTTQITERVTGITVARTKENQLFLRNCNNAAQQARGKYIFFLNNDTQVQKGWLQPLVDLMEKDETVGLTGSKLVYGDGSLQEAGGILWKDGSAWNYGRNGDASRSEFNYVREADYISGAAIMIRAGLWEELGGFDELFAPAYYEDTDLAFQVRDKGYKVVYQPASVVVHFEGKSNGTDVSSGAKAYQVANAKKFYQKWQKVLERDHFENGENVFLARDRSRSKKHILVVDHYIPEPDKDAGGRCTYMYLLQFAKMGMHVTFIGDNFSPDEPYLSDLESRGIEVLYGDYYYMHHKEWLAENGKYFDYVYLQRPHISIKWIDNVKRYCTKAKFFYFAHDLHHLREYREYKITGDEEHLKESEHWKGIEFKLFNAVDVVHVVGSYEQAYLQERLPDKPIRNIPLYIYDNVPTDINKDFSSRNDILFVGGFGHPPNEDAVLWFAKEIYPVILEHYPTMVWHIVGGGVPDAVKALASDNIVIHGRVSDEELESFYRTCRLAVVPLRYGAGVKGKIVEAAYYQIPMVTTPIGAEGMSTEEGTMMVAETAQDIAEAVCNLYEDFNRLREMSDAGTTFIERYFSQGAVDAALAQDLDPAI